MSSESLVSVVLVGVMVFSIVGLVTSLSFLVMFALSG
jgi:hypothetical protein